MNDSNRVSLTKPENSSSANPSQGYRDPATGEIYPNRPDSVQQGSFVPGNSQGGYVQNGAVQQGFQQGYIQQTPYQQEPMPQMYQQQYQPVQQVVNGPTKFCKHCGQLIPQDAVLCTHCGRQVEELRGAASQPIIINNNNNNNNVAAASVVGTVPAGREKNKWVALILCFFFGCLGIHRFYEGKIGTGLLWLFTGGLFFVGAFIDFIILLFKKNPYYV